MKMDLSFREVYPHPIEKVWNAVATRSGLESWLMENDFVPGLGHQCTFRFCDRSDQSHESRVYVTVDEIDPPHHMVWSWRNENEPEASRVTFDLREVAGRTELTVTHIGPVSDGLSRDLEKGWPKKIVALQEALST